MSCSVIMNVINKTGQEKESKGSRTRGHLPLLQRAVTTAAASRVTVPVEWRTGLYMWCPSVPSWGTQDCWATVLNVVGVLNVVEMCDLLLSSIPGASCWNGDCSLFLFRWSAVFAHLAYRWRNWPGLPHLHVLLFDSVVALAVCLGHCHAERPIFRFPPLCRSRVKMVLFGSDPQIATFSLKSFVSQVDISSQTQGGPVPAFLSMGTIRISVCGVLQTFFRWLRSQLPSYHCHCAPAL